MKSTPEVLGIDVRLFRRRFGIVCAAEDDGDHVVVEDLEELLGDVVFAEGVLEAEVELVLGLEHLHAAILVRF